jgi:serine-type D-Ala-D-Ala endopeptidase (penicillin-binding protein 7)
VGIAAAGRRLTFSCIYFDLSGFFGILSSRGRDRSRNMNYKLLPLLLLSYTLLAQAAGDEQLSAAQSDKLAASALAQPAGNNSPIQEEIFSADEELQADENEEFEPAEKVAVTDVPPLSPVMKIQKAYDDLLKAIPQLVFGNADANKKEETPSEAKPKNDLSLAVQKFAALPRMRSSIVMIYDENGNQPLHSRNANVVTPIASITKLMTAMVVLDAKLPLDEEISIIPEDINRKKRTRSRTRAGMTMTRGELLKLALMASDNLSAAALARTYPGGTEAALAQMNIKAQQLGMNSSRFLDPTGLNSGNVSTANDLVKMVQAAQGYELIHQFTTSTSHTLELAGHRPLQFHNTNPLVRNASWDIGLSKTGYISEAGRCLVMEAKIEEHPVIIVLLDSWGRNSRVGDANRVKKWMEKGTRSTRDM